MWNVRTPILRDPLEYLCSIHKLHKHIFIYHH